MTNLIIQVSKYLIIILMALYTFQCFTVFHKKDDEAREYLFLRQNMLMFAMHFVAFTVLYLEKTELTVLMFYGAQMIYLVAVLVLFRNLYPLASKLLINNMCMLICIGFIMLTRLNYDKCIKQFQIAVLSTVVALLIPVIIRKLRFITKMYWFYTLAGIGLLALVAIAARVTYGAKLSFTVGGISVQPSEFVKIIYVFAIAGLLSNARNFKKIVVATVLAAIHVLILVVSKDLGSAVIFFITYLVMLFVATKNPFLVLTGILSGSLAAVGAYFLFAHVRVRVEAWKDPFKDYQGGSYQICQSLFSISAGGWLGTGLCQGSPNAIPFVEQDMMFSAVTEELGGIFGICLILVCMSCFIMFVNIAMQLSNRFYRLVAVGLGSTYATQIFLTIGGGIKLIPLTGVTLPFVSYGGSSMLSTLIMFAIVQGLYMLQRDEEKKNQEKLLRQSAPGGGYGDSYGGAGGPYRGGNGAYSYDGGYAGGYRDGGYDGGSYSGGSNGGGHNYGGDGSYGNGYGENGSYGNGYGRGSDSYGDGYDENGSYGSSYGRSRAYEDNYGEDGSYGDDYAGDGSYGSGYGRDRAYEDDYGDGYGPDGGMSGGYGNGYGEDSYGGRYGENGAYGDGYGGDDYGEDGYGGGDGYGAGYRGYGPDGGMSDGYRGSGYGADDSYEDGGSYGQEEDYRYDGGYEDGYGSTGKKKRGRKKKR